MATKNNINWKSKWNSKSNSLFKKDLLDLAQFRKMQTFEKTLNKVFKIINLWRFLQFVATNIYDVIMHSGEVTSPPDEFDDEQYYVHNQ